MARLGLQRHQLARAWVVHSSLLVQKSPKNCHPQRVQLVPSAFSRYFDCPSKGHWGSRATLQCPTLFKLLAVVLRPPEVSDPQPAHQQYFTVTQAQPQSMRLQGQFPGQGKVLGTPHHEGAQCLCKHQRKLATFTSSGDSAQQLAPLRPYSSMSEASSTPRHIACLAHLQVFSSPPPVPIEGLAPSVLLLPFPQLGFTAEIIPQSSAFF